MDNIGLVLGDGKGRYAETASSRRHGI